jgi:hypothetical protein
MKIKSTVPLLVTMLSTIVLAGNSGMIFAQQEPLLPGSPTTGDTTTEAGTPTAGGVPQDGLLITPGGELIPFRANSTEEIRNAILALQRMVAIPAEAGGVGEGAIANAAIVDAQINRLAEQAAGATAGGVGEEEDGGVPPGSTDITIKTPIGDIEITGCLGVPPFAICL